MTLRSRPPARSSSSRRSPGTPGPTDATLRYNKRAEQYYIGVGEIRLDAKFPPRHPGPTESPLRVDYRSRRNRNNRIVQPKEERFNSSDGNDATLAYAGPENPGSWPRHSGYVNVAEAVIASASSPGNCKSRSRCRPRETP